MKSSEIRKKFLDFFEKNNHHILESASVVTPDEKGVTNSTLFNTAGVQPLISNILNGDHPKGDRLASAQKCIRTIDIDEVGDNTHLTFFEMLGNWSLGDYFKEEAIKMSFEFLTSKTDGLGLDKDRLYITVFKGNTDAPKDEEAFEIWKKYIPESRIYFLEANWWAAGENGPCGPDTEIFYDLTEKGLGEMSLSEYEEADEKQQVIEIWNNVFMQYEKKDNVVIGKLKKHAVDTGAGLERLVTVLNKKESIFETDLFLSLREEIYKKISKDLHNKDTEKSVRILMDHVRAAVVIISDGIVPSNEGRGSILRNLFIRAYYETNKLEIDFSDVVKLVAEFVIDKYEDFYTNLKEKEEFILTEIKKEVNRITENKSEDKIKSQLEKSFKKMRDVSEISGDLIFLISSEQGIHKDKILDFIQKENLPISENFEKEYTQAETEHKNKSRLGAMQKFKGGLAGNSEIEIKYHTATHLLHQALCDVLGDSVEQKGSNINPERLRFDFSHPQKLTDEEKSSVEKIINQKIQESLAVNNIELPIEEALKTNSKHLFNEKYGEIISIYYIGDNLENAYSKEFCGGPHVKNTKELGKFKIVKEEAVSQGVRRIKATLE